MPDYPFPCGASLVHLKGVQLKPFRGTSCTAVNAVHTMYGRVAFCRKLHRFGRFRSRIDGPEEVVNESTNPLGTVTITKRIDLASEVLKAAKGCITS